MNDTDYIFREDVLLYDSAIFGDDDEHEYNAKCYDGYAIAERSETEDGKVPLKLKMTYPKLSEVLKDDALAKEVLDYSGLFDLQPKDINYGDIMLCFGTIEKLD